MKEEKEIKQRKFLIRYLIAMDILFVLVVLFVSLNNESTADEVFLLPEGFEGCINIYYDQEGKEALEIENNEIVYEVSKEGNVLTSSPSEFGNLGWHKIYVSYVDENGKVSQRKDITGQGQDGMTSNGSFDRRIMLFDDSKETCH